MKRLATMEVEKENTEMVKPFFDLLNKALQEYISNPNYKFNPCMILTDKVGANLQGIKDVFGPKYLDRITSCHFHFKQCTCRQLHHINENQ